MPSLTSDELWSTKYAAPFAAAREREERLRAEAFVELPRLVAGEPLRVMTARDLHLLDGAGNAFVCGTVPTPGDIAVLLWQLHARRPPTPSLRGAWEYGRLMGRLRRKSAVYLSALEEIRDYLEFVFFDAPTSGAKMDRRAFGGSFVVPLLASLSAELGPVDPLTGRTWGSLPLPQIFQFQKFVARRQLGADYIDRNPSDRLLSDYAAELNAQEPTHVLRS